MQFKFKSMSNFDPYGPYGNHVFTVSKQNSKIAKQNSGITKKLNKNLIGYVADFLPPSEHGKLIDLKNKKFSMALPKGQPFRMIGADITKNNFSEMLYDAAALGGEELATVIERIGALSDDALDEIGDKLFPAAMQQIRKLELSDRRLPLASLVKEVRTVKDFECLREEINKIPELDRSEPLGRLIMRLKNLKIGDQEVVLNKLRQEVMNGSALQGYPSIGLASIGQGSSSSFESFAKLLDNLPENERERSAMLYLGMGFIKNDGLGDISRLPKIISSISNDGHRYLVIKQALVNFRNVLMRDISLFSEFLNVVRSIENKELRVVLMEYLAMEFPEGEFLDKFKGELKILGAPYEAETLCRMREADYRDPGSFFKRWRRPDNGTPEYCALFGTRLDSKFRQATVPPKPNKYLAF